MAIAQLTQVFYDPSAAFAALKERPRPWLPLLLLYGAMLALVVWYFRSVDIDWMIGQSLPPQASAEERAAAVQMMGRDSLMGISIAGMLIGTLAVYALFGLYFWIAGKLADFQLSFKSGFALAAWASLPGLIGMPLMVLQIATGQGQVSLEGADMLSLNFLLVHAPPHTPWFGIASGIKLTDLWFILLCAIGLRAWTGKGMAACAVIAALPYLLFYGCWAAWVLFRN